MMLDQFTLSAATAVVISVSAAVYLFETLMRKDGLSGRLWAAAFLVGVLTVISYLVWAADPAAYLAVAIGNAGFVSTAAFMWLGCRAFNGRRLRWPAALVGAAIVAAFVAVIVAGSRGGDWAGAIPFFLGTGIPAALGAVESRRGAMGRRWSSLGLTIVLGVEGVWFLSRAVVFAALGPEHELFRVWFGTQVSSLLTITLTVVAVVVTSVLRASESNLRGQRDVYTLSVGVDGVMLPASFQSVVATVLERAVRTRETLCLVSVRVDDLARIANAFGPAEAEQVAGAWRAGVRRYAPTVSIVGEGEAHSILIAFLTTSFADVRRMASIMHRRLLDDFAVLGVSVIPVVGVGIALTDTLGYDYCTLAVAAEAAAARSTISSDASVIIAER